MCCKFYKYNIILVDYKLVMNFYVCSYNRCLEGEDPPTPQKFEVETTTGATPDLLIFEEILKSNSRCKACVRRCKRLCSNFKNAIAHNMVVGVNLLHKMEAQGKIDHKRLSFLSNRLYRNY